MHYGVMTSPGIEDLSKELSDKSKKLAELKQALEPQDVDDAGFQTLDGGKTTLLELFGDKQDLILVHNMGASCPYCTLWADGLNGLRAYLSDRAAFVVSSPDAPAAMKSFREKRGWQFQMVSIAGTRFAHEQGFAEDKDGTTYWLPGVTTFRRTEAGKIQRIGQAAFGPGDSFCSVWPLFDMLHQGPGEWQPKYNLPS